jgi:predicted TIM-barrel fold metal-dependent hydrolase
MSEYCDRIHEGLPLDDVEIIDIHAHLGPYWNMHIPANDAESMIKIMDLCGIDKAVVSSHIGLSSDFVMGNDLVIEAIRAHRGRIYGACGVNGNYPELSLDELHRCFSEEKDMKIIKIHPFLAKCKMDDPRMKMIYEFAVKHNLLVLTHTWLEGDSYGSLDIFKNVAKDYPDITWIMGHSGGTYGNYHAVQITKELKNVLLDITMSTCPARQIEYFVSEVGSERVLFGTDNPFLDPRPEIGRVGLADISHRDRVNIFGANVRRFVDFD